MSLFDKQHRETRTHKEMTNMLRRKLNKTGFACGLVATLSIGASALASSHREAPAITEDPKADSTDVYAFISPDGPAPGSGATVTLIANYVPFQAPAGGPNYFTMSDDVLYEIKIDNTGDAVEDITYEFRFTTETRSGATFLYNTGLIDSPESGGLNVVQRYSVWRTDANGRSSLGSNIAVAPTRIGPRSNGDQSAYEAVAAASVASLPNGQRVFVGPRDEGFYLDINAIFDLLNISRTDGLGSGTALDGTKGFNVNTIAIQVPVTMLTADGSEPTLTANPPLGGNNAVIGVWTTASRRKHRVLRGHDNAKNFGPWVQVSRLGLPLINEVVVPLGFKDQFSRTEPSQDLENIAGFVVDPELSRLLAAVHGLEVPPAPRTDMVSVISFLPGALTSRADLQPADLLRLNMAIPASATENNLGVIAGDNAGFPNGRRVGDDVVDILERVVGGGILSSADCYATESVGAGFDCADGGGTPQSSFGMVFPNNAMNDGVNANDVPFLSAFPYLGTPHEGFVHSHD